MYSKTVREYAGKNKQGELIIQSMITLEQLSFAAFLTGFTQSFKSNWNTETVYGRNDDIATFQGTKRSYSLAFDVPSGNLEQAQAALEQIDKLIKFLYPAYNDIELQPLYQAQKKNPTDPIGPKSVGKVLSHAPLVKVRFANLLRSSKPATGKNDSQGLLGYLDGLEWAPNLEMGMFLEGNGNVYPKVISLSFGFTVLHQVDLGWQQSKPKETLYKGQSFFPNSVKPQKKPVKKTASKAAPPKKKTP